MNLRPPSHRRRTAPRLQFTSMIDVVFLLLIFFMTTTSLAIPEAQLSSALQVERESGRAADLLPQIVEATTQVQTPPGVDPLDGAPTIEMRSMTRRWGK